MQEPLLKPYPRGHSTSFLHLAAAAGMLRVVPLLLARGASAAATDSDGLSPIEVAERRGRTAMVALLIAGVPDKCAAGLESDAPPL